MMEHRHVTTEGPDQLGYVKLYCSCGWATSWRRGSEAQLDLQHHINQALNNRNPFIGAR